MEHRHLLLVITLGFIAALGIATLVLVVLTFDTVNKQYDTLKQRVEILDQKVTDLNSWLSTTTTISTRTSISPMTTAYLTTFEATMTSELLPISEQTL